MSSRLLGSCTLLLCCSLTLQAAFSCAAVSPAEQLLLLQAIREKCQIDPEISLRLSSDEVSNEHCFRKLVLEGHSSIRTWSLAVFLSPDHRYISSDLFSIYPAMSLDLKYVPEIGSKEAAVTVTLFSDFQCSSCGTVTDILKTMVHDDKSKSFKVEYRNFPLTGHSWALSAAEGAACAELQNEQAFWSLRDRIFADQENITTETVRRKLIAYSYSIPSLNKPQFETCLEKQGTLGLVYRDIDLAAKYSVRALPTVLINGNTIQLPTNQQQIRRSLEQGLRQEKSRLNTQEDRRHAY